MEPGPPGDLDRQDALTWRLMATRPHYHQPWLGGPAGWAEAVEKQLDVPVVLTSHGPTAENKSPRGIGCQLLCPANLLSSSA